jgi:hypothetical protein
MIDGICFAHITVTVRSIMVVSRMLPHTEVSLYKSHTTEESFMRRRSDRYSQVQSGHSDCVVGSV